MRAARFDCSVSGGEGFKEGECETQHIWKQPEEGESTTMEEIHDKMHTPLFELLPGITLSLLWASGSLAVGGSLWLGNALGLGGSFWLGSGLWLGGSLWLGDSLGLGGSLGLGSGLGLGSRLSLGGSLGLGSNLYKIGKYDFEFERV
jgi:hypothetical protein